MFPGQRTNHSPEVMIKHHTWFFGQPLIFFNRSPPCPVPQLQVMPRESLRRITGVTHKTLFLQRITAFQWRFREIFP